MKKPLIICQITSLTYFDNIYIIRIPSSQASLGVPRYRRMIGKSAFSYTGATDWKILPSGATTTVNMFHLKTKI